MEKIVRLVYSSKETEKLSNKDFIQMVAQSQKNNFYLDITGMLLHLDEYYFQVLEGEKDETMKLYERIKLDNRHKEVKTVFIEHTDKRYFSDWSMGYTILRKVDIEKIKGMEDFFQFNGIEDMSLERAKKLVCAFVENEHILIK
ncbi:sensor of blue-light using FAD [Thiovulum sp. ES]|nr:sensor of blue-light using FAD [Thiovulum sp. ES]